MPQLAVRPIVRSLASLGRNESPLLVENVGDVAADNVIVEMRVRETTYEFDCIDKLAPRSAAPLTSNGHTGRFIFQDMAVSVNWFRAEFRGAVASEGKELRVPLAIRYRDANGVERSAFQVLHCDEQLRLSVTDD